MQSHKSATRVENFHLSVRNVAVRLTSFTLAINVVLLLERALSLSTSCSWIDICCEQLSTTGDRSYCNQAEGRRRTLGAGIPDCNIWATIVMAKGLVSIQATLLIIVIELDDVLDELVAGIQVLSIEELAQLRIGVVEKIRPACPNQLSLFASVACHSPYKLLWTPEAIVNLKQLQELLMALLGSSKQ